MNDAADILRKSVTAADHNKNGASGSSVINFFLPGATFDGSLPLPLSPYWSRNRDWQLRATVYQESMWSAAISIAITKMTALSWDVKSAVKGEAPQLTKRAHELLHNADAGKGWTQFLSKQLRDFLTTDNGQHFEIVRASSAKGSRILGLMHLDSMRCTRTGDPERPILYRDKQGHEHELRWWQVCSLADMPDSGETWNGVGLCAASRAHTAIRKLAAVEWFFIERITGRRPLKIYIVSGLNDRKLKGAMKAADDQASAEGLTVYMGAVVLPTSDERPPQIVEIPLAEIPAAFDRREEFDLSILTYANAIGLDVQDLQPLSGQGLGTGTQSVVLDDKASGKGLAAWRQQFSYAINEYATSASVSFVFIEKDWRDKQARVEVHSSLVGMLVSAADPEKGIISKEQALQIAVDEEVFPREFLSVDTTPDTSLSSDEKPEELETEATISQGSATRGQPATPALRASIQRVIGAMKEARYKQDAALDALVDGIAEQIAQLTGELESGAINVGEWEQRVLQLIEQAHTDAYVAGGGPLDKNGRSVIEDAVNEQRSFLRQFAQEIGESLAKGTYLSAWLSRSAMYGLSARASYWRAQTRGIPLPALPGDGTTQCLTRCRCSWDIERLEGDGNADAYWKRHTDDSCQTCIARASRWSPVRIRNGELQS